MTAQTIWGIVIILAACAFLAAGIMISRYCSGFRSGHTEEAIARLTNAECHRNVSINRSGTMRGDLTYYTYTYTAGGKACHIEGVFRGTPKQLPSGTRVVFQKANPRRGYLPEFQPRPEEDAHGLCYYLFAVLLLWGLFTIIRQ